MSEPSSQARARDFDFLVGSWNIVNERLTARLVNSDTWECFAATGDCELILGGLGNVDRFHSVRNGAAFDAISLSPHPDAADVLSLIGKHHPDKQIAKAARRSFDTLVIASKPVNPRK